MHGADFFALKVDYALQSFLHIYRNNTKKLRKGKYLSFVLMLICMQRGCLHILCCCQMEEGADVIERWDIPNLHFPQGRLVAAVIVSIALSARSASKRTEASSCISGCS